MSNKEILLDKLYGLLAKFLDTIGSTKFWFTLIGMGLAGYAAYKTGGSIGAILAALAFLGLPGTYVVAKTYQNTHGENDPSVIRMQLTQELPTHDYIDPTIKPEPIPEPIPEIVFDQDAFEKDMANKEGSYPEHNPATKFYTAADTFEDWFNQGKLKNRLFREVAEYVIVYAELAFTYIWGDTYSNELLNLSKPVEIDGQTCHFTNINSKAKRMGFGRYEILGRLRRWYQLAEQGHV